MCHRQELYQDTHTLLILSVERVLSMIWNFTRL